MVTSRDRCIRSILLEEPDRIPLDLFTRPEPYKLLKANLGIQDQDTMKVMKSLGIDIIGSSIPIKGGYLPSNIEKKEGPYQPAYTVGFRDGFEVRKDIWGIHSIWAPNHTYTFTYLDHPLKTIKIDDYVWPEVDAESVDSVQKIRKECEDYCLRGGVIHLWEQAWQLTGFQEIMRMMFRNPTMVHKVLAPLHKIRMKQVSLLCEAGVDIIADGDDVGMQKGMMMSPQMWRHFLKPYYAKIINRCHKKGAFFHFHSDGWIEPIIPDLIGIGVDILNPVQPECMDPFKLKNLYGNILCFHGTIGVQSILPFGSSEDVAREVKERISTLGPTGLILSPTHSMQQDVSTENILTLYQTALKYGWNTRRVPLR